MNGQISSSEISGLTREHRKTSLWEYTSGITPNTTPKMHPDVWKWRGKGKGALN